MTDDGEVAPQETAPMPVYEHLPGIGYREFIIALGVLIILFGHRLPSVMARLGKLLFRGPWD
jgi:hypothetical protein